MLEQFISAGSGELKQIRRIEGEQLEEVSV
jgi:hypothetical protein